MPETTTVAWDLSDLFDSIQDPRIEESLDEEPGARPEVCPDIEARSTARILPRSCFLKPFANMRACSGNGEADELCFAGLLRRHRQVRARRVPAARAGEADDNLTGAYLLRVGADGRVPEIIDRLVADPIMGGIATSFTRRGFSASTASASRRRESSKRKPTPAAGHSSGFSKNRYRLSSSNLTIHGEQQSLTEPEVLALLRDPDREVRKAAAASLTEGLARTAGC